MEQLLKEKYPYLVNFFDTALSSKNNGVANSIIFYGSDVLAQYYLALSIAKALNCENNSQVNSSCECRNCNWIKANKHPAVMTISKIDNKSDTSKTVISKEQVDEMRDILFSPSDYHRVFVFCDADFKVLEESEKEHILEFAPLEFVLPESQSEELSWYPRGITKNCFQEVAANSILKSIEEPPENVTFIFLTQDKDDLISTIVSRSQAFFVPNSTRNICYNKETLNEILVNYPKFETQNALHFSRELLEYQQKMDYAPSRVLDCLQEYLLDIIKSNLNNDQLVRLIKNDILKIQESKKMLAAFIKEQTVYEDLAFYLASR